MSELMIAGMWARTIDRDVDFDVAGSCDFGFGFGFDSEFDFDSNLSSGFDTDAGAEA
ncbi:hypothetical protein JL09_g5706 [Pichia kudriavzevii]|uniref:Uncharacterized protein n=1 Tax=Pichia kudriavzevii TaxID=4909 RepID=A0A099NSX1_PICKU|nr:hypothetical protein JL09_g5706 [Pichia kudriavzevii]